jgi:hypothetical protein
MKQVLVACLLPLGMLCASTSSANAVSFKFKSADGLCPMTQDTSEGRTMWQLMAASANAQTAIISVYVDCKTIDDIKSGIKDMFLPIIILSTEKTDGEILPYSTWDYSNLKKNIEKVLSSYKWTEDQERASAAFQKLIDARQSSVSMTYQAMAPVIVDSSDKTVSVAQNSEIQMKDKKHKLTGIETTTIVDGYIVHATVMDEIATPKDFWRMQLWSEMLARQIEKTDGPPSGGPAIDSDGQSPGPAWESFQDDQFGRSVAIEAGYDASQNQSQPTLVVRCGKDKATNVYVIFADRNFKPNKAIQVMLAVDGTVKRSVWQASADGHGIGVWDNAGAISLVKSLLFHSGLRIEAQSGKLSTGPLAFEIHGIEGAIADVGRDCRW